VRFNEHGVREVGRTAMGVIGIRLDKDDEVVSLEIIENAEAQVLTVTDMGYGKRTVAGDYRITRRGGKGVMTIRTTDKNGKVVCAFQVTNDMEVMIITTHAGKVIRMKVSEISTYGRVSQGLRLIDLKDDEKVAAVAKVMERDQDQ